jgi:hypothetical protein
VSLWLVLLAASLGTMKVVDFLKEIMPWPLQPWTKSFLSVLVAGGLMVSFAHGISQIVLLTLGAAGLAALAHELTDFLWLGTDFLKQQVILRGTTRRRA